MCLSWYVGFLLTHFCCAFLSVVLSEEQKQSVNMFVDPVNKFFQVWCVCACVRAYVRACVRACVHACVLVYAYLLLFLCVYRKSMTLQRMTMQRLFYLKQ